MKLLKRHPMANHSQNWPNASFVTQYVYQVSHQIMETAAAN